MGQGCSSVHVETHAIGLVFYELTSMVHEYGLEHMDKVEQRIDEYIDLLLKWNKKINQEQFEFTSFLLDDSKPNKEQLLYLKKMCKDNEKNANNKKVM